jgi:hypothetical protein
MARAYSVHAMGTTPPKLVVDLVERFDRDRKVFLSPDYKEEQLRASSGPSPSIRHSDFVIRTSPHESLGWDVSNKAGLTEFSKPVIHEESIKACPARSYGGAATLGRKIAGSTKAPVVNVSVKPFAA